MKKTLKSISFLLAGMLIFSACTEEKTGKSPEKIADKIEVELEDIVQDTVPIDSVEIEEPVPPPPPPVPEPMPPGPEPYPYPIPEPEPWPEPYPEPSLPEPVPVQVNPVVDFPDVEPEFVGGELALRKFVANNVQYPQIDLEQENQGRVYVGFIVEKDGSLSDVKVVRGVSEGLDREAVRVIRKMPNWKPGESRGKTVRCRARLPISFVME